MPSKKYKLYIYNYEQRLLSGYRAKNRDLHLSISNYPRRYYNSPTARAVAHVGTGARPFLCMPSTRPSRLMADGIRPTTHHELGRRNGKWRAGKILCVLLPLLLTATSCFYYLAVSYPEQVLYCYGNRRKTRGIKNAESSWELGRNDQG